MKKTKIGIIVAMIFITIVTIIVTLLSTSTVSLGGGDSEWSALWNGGPNISWGSSGARYGFLVSDVTAGQYNNIYCIEHGGMLRSAKTVSWWSGYSNLYYVSAVITLTGAPSGSGCVKYYGRDDFWFGSEEGVNQR